MPLAGKHDDIQWNKFHQEPTNHILNRACRSGGHCWGHSITGSTEMNWATEMAPINLIKSFELI